MKRESARSLKRELLGGDLWRGIGRPARATLTGRAARAARPAPRRVSLALGLRGRGDQYRLAVRIQEIAPGLDTVLERITKRARGEVDIRLIGDVTKQARWYRSRNRPLRMGGSIGHVQVTAGTLGCFVSPRSGPDDDERILSNNHVLANENRARTGDEVVQPGPLDGGKARGDAVAQLTRFVPLRQNDNRVDAAVATLVDGIEYYYQWLEGVGTVRGVRADLPDEGELVYKVGRTTGVTSGRISAIELDALRVQYDMGVVTFSGQIEMEPLGGNPFSRRGDSGALIVDRGHHAVGLLFAGNDVDATYAHPIGDVLDALDADLVV